MKIRKGTDRLVLIFPSLGFVIKLPRFYIWMTIKNILRYIWNWNYFKEWLNYSPEAYTGIQRLLYKGLRDNWHEYTFYRDTHHPFLQPTYFSLFGFMNIQKYGDQQEIRFDILLNHFMNITNNEAYTDNHHFANWRNFCFENGKIKITDYGCPRTQKVITPWGDVIIAKFDLAKVLKNS